MKIKMIATGGTIDKKYIIHNGELGFDDTQLEFMLQQGRCSLDVSIQRLQLIDSLDMDDSYKALISKTCQLSTESKIVISHGTDTMVDTAKVLAKSKIDKTIVLFGAMIPFAVNNSDALFNLGCAISAVQYLPKGVYIAMNGTIFNWDNVIKNKSLGVFETINT